MMDDYYFCNRCMYAWLKEQPPYCPYCGGEPTHVKAGMDSAAPGSEFTGYELWDGAIVHMSSNAQPETIEALKEMLCTLLETR